MKLDCCKSLDIGTNLIPVSVNVRRAEGKGVVNQSWINRLSTSLGGIEQISQVAQVSVATSDSIPGAILV